MPAPNPQLTQVSSSALSFGSGGARVPEQPRDDLVAVKAAVLDEHLVRVEARHHDAGDEHAGHRRLERLRIVRGNARHRIDRHADLRAADPMFGAKPVMTYTRSAGSRSSPLRST